MKVSRMLKTPQRLRALLPYPVKALLRELSVFLLFSDWMSVLAYIRVVHPFLAKRLPPTTSLKVRQLQGKVLTIRTKGADHVVVFDAFVHQFHLPPLKSFPSDDLLFLDLGANIGCTMAHMACLFPKARIVGVELDGENVALCRQNIAPWRDRCQVVEAGVWYEDGEVCYSRPKEHQNAFHISESADEECFKTRAITISSVLREYSSSNQMVDYLKMDIEGAERHVLRHGTEWAARIRCIKVELHDYTHSECISDLERLGFRAIQDSNHNLCVVGFRN